MDTVTLNNGVVMPLEGFGVFQSQTERYAGNLFWTPLHLAIGLLIQQQRT